VDIGPNFYEVYAVVQTQTATSARGAMKFAIQLPKCSSKACDTFEIKFNFQKKVRKL
jgi:hypothetical protein